MRPRLEQADEERAGAGEGVDDVDVLFAQPALELVAQDVLDAVDDEVHHFDRRVDDAQGARPSREGGAEELVVKLDDDALAALGVVDAGGAVADAGVELFERGSLLLQRFLVEHVEHLLHRLRDGVVLA